MEIPFPPQKKCWIKCLFVREGSASIAAFSVSLNTVYNNIVLRVEGDTTKWATDIMKVFQDLWQRLALFGYFLFIQL